MRSVFIKNNRYLQISLLFLIFFIFTAYLYIKRIAGHDLTHFQNQANNYKFNTFKQEIGMKKVMAIIAVVFILGFATSPVMAGAGPAPNSGNGVSDGSGPNSDNGKAPGPAPSSGDGDPDGSGF